MILLAGGLSAAPGRERNPGNVELRFGLMSEPRTLDPLSTSNTADGRMILFNVYEGLVKSDPVGILQPAVAESYEMSSDAMTYTFTLRQGLRFHDGSLVTIEDVEFSLAEARSIGALGFSQINRIELVGDRTIRIILNDPDPDFLPYLTTGIVPKNNPDREGNAIGTGPFAIQSYITQQHLVLTRNSHYWQPNLPRMDTVTVVFTADNNALFTGLEGGNLNGAMVSSDVAENLDRTKFQITDAYSNSVQLLALNNDVPPLNDLRVRQALNYAIDKQEIIDIAFYGRGRPSGSPLIPALSVYYNEDTRNPYPTDLTRARALLAEAGYSSGFNLEIKVPSNFSMHVDTAQVIVNQLARIGVRASIRLLDWATWLTEVNRDRNYEATIISLDGRTVSPLSFLSRYISTASGNFLNFRNDEYDRLYQQIQREINTENRIRLYKEAQRIISDNAAAVFIQDIFAFKVFNGFGGAQNYPLYVIDFSTIYQN